MRPKPRVHITELSFDLEIAGDQQVAYGNANAINAAGKVVGSAYVQSDRLNACEWQDGTTLQPDFVGYHAGNEGNVSWYVESQFLDVNSVGYLSITVDVPFPFGDLRTWEELAVGNTTVPFPGRACGINVEGDVVGCLRQNGAAGVGRAVLWRDWRNVRPCTCLEPGARKRSVWHQ